MKAVTFAQAILDDAASASCTRFRNEAVRLVPLLFTIALIWTSLGAAQAQGFGGAGPSTLPSGMTAADCNELARLPNSPISVATCKSMMGMAAGMDAAADDPRAQRPGDGALTCPQIFAELQTRAGAGISELNRGSVPA